MHGYKPAHWGESISDVQNANGNPLYKSVELKWSTPTIWRKGERRPKFDDSTPFVYALIRNHGKSATKDHILYIGLTQKPKTRFGNHNTAKNIVAMPGEVKFSYAQIDFVQGRNRVARTKRTMEEIEHLLIWAVYYELQNEKKQYTVPGMGANGGDAWHITNSGYRFSGRMPREIVFPWMMVKPGRGRFRKRAQIN